MTSLTLITLVVALYGVLNPLGYGRAVALGGAPAAGAAAAVGGIAVPTFYALAIGAVVALGLDLLGFGRRPKAVRRPLPAGVPLLLTFLAWCALVVLMAPVIFDGIPVFPPQGDSALLAGHVTSSNIAQLGYLAIGVCVVMFLARSPYSRPELLGLAVCTPVVLSMWRYGHTEVGLPFPEGLFDNSPTLSFIETAPGGGERFRGILSEPSSLGASCLVALAYCLSRIGRTTGRRRIGLVAVAASAAYLGSISTSGTFVVAVVALVLIAAATLGVGFLLRRVRMSTVTAVGLCAMCVASLWLLPQAASSVQSTVDDKVGSSSYDERTTADTQSYDLFLATDGVGVGPGSNRASSFLPSLLSTTGAPGVALLGLTIAVLIGRTADLQEYRPVIWALVALLVLKCIAGPDLSDGSGVLWLSLGLLSHGATPRPPGPVPDDGAVDLRPGTPAAAHRATPV